MLNTDVCCLQPLLITQHERTQFTMICTVWRLADSDNKTFPGKWHVLFCGPASSYVIWPDILLMLWNKIHPIYPEWKTVLDIT